MSDTGLDRQDEYVGPLIVNGRVADSMNGVPIRRGKYMMRNDDSNGRLLLYISSQALDGLSQGLAKNNTMGVEGIGGADYVVDAIFPGVFEGKHTSWAHTFEGKFGLAIALPKHGLDDALVNRLLDYIDDEYKRLSPAPVVDPLSSQQEGISEILWRKMCNLLGLRSKK